MKAYITKYCLAEGIKEVEGEINQYSPSGLDVRAIDGCPLYFGKGSWHKTREAAVAKAEQMRAKKVAVLKTQIAKLEKLKFE